MENDLNQNLLNSIEVISCAASTCELNFNKLENVRSEIKQIADFLCISEDQAVIFSCLTELSFQKTVTLENLAKHLNCSVLKVIAYMNVMEALEKKGYIQKNFRRRGRKHSYNDMGFSVPHYVIEAVRTCNASMLLSASVFDLPGFLKQASSVVDERFENTLSTSQAKAEIEFLISMNGHLPFVSFIDLNLTKIISKCTMFALSYVRLKGQYQVSIESFANSLFDDLGDQLEFAQEVASGIHELVTKNFLQVVTSEFDGEKHVTLSPNVAKELYKDYPALMVSESDNSGLISYKSLTAKKLWFSEEVGKQIEDLGKVLRPCMFRSYRKELHRNKLSKGITAAFFGEPGTGKTEAVYQLARKTGRDIMMVDLSETKSKWFGESEKLVKKIFDNYSALLQKSDIEPILFINEADGLFTRRIDLNTGRGNSSEQAINTIQNILLQALENFEGILLATTNLTKNLDKAFERRFTFKIDFPKPDSIVRKNIWMSKMPELSESEATALGDKFEITGGEIDVQVRQVILKRILNKKLSLYDAVYDCCRKDHGFSVKKKVGF
jgi:hypothetical protein